jgi:hypothetical protein
MLVWPRLLKLARQQNEPLIVGLVGENFDGLECGIERIRATCRIAGYTRGNATDLSARQRRLAPPSVVVKKNRFDLC